MAGRDGERAVGSRLTGKIGAGADRRPRVRQDLRDLTDRDALCRVVSQASSSPGSHLDVVVVGEK